MTYPLCFNMDQFIMYVNQLLLTQVLELMHAWHYLRFIFLNMHSSIEKYEKHIYYGKELRPTNPLKSSTF